MAPAYSLLTWSILRTQGAADEVRDQLRDDLILQQEMATQPGTAAQVTGSTSSPRRPTRGTT